MIKGIIFDIKRYAVHDGPGIRTTVFLKGCPLRCLWCHNPEGISISKEIMYFEYKCIKCKTCEYLCPLNAIEFIDGKHYINRDLCNLCEACVENCPSGALSIVGKEVGVNELFEEIEKDVLLYDSSGGGVTFSGGEPLFQHKFLKEVLKKCKEKKIHVALDTSGYTSKEILESIIPYVDLFLYDFKIFDDEKHKKYTGVSNKLIKENLKFLTKKNKEIIVRIPWIPGVNDNEIQKIFDFLYSLKNIKEVHLLPFHDVREKYERLGKKYLMSRVKSNSEKVIYEIEKFSEKTGIPVKTGG